MPKIKPPMREILDSGVPIRCPKCGYSYHRAIGAGTTPIGIDPYNIELECGRCEKHFYVFLREAHA